MSGNSAGSNPQTKKKYGTDFPGQIIILIIFSIFFSYSNSFKEKNFPTSVFLIIISLAYFAITIKITNALVLIILFIIFLHLRKKILPIFFSILFSIPLILWMVQNYFLSKCLIWPISFLCFGNIEAAINYRKHLNAFHKSILKSGFSDSDILAHLKNFNWVPFWFKSHFPKILEIHFIYLFFLLLPIIIYQCIKIYNNTNKNYKSLNNFFILELDNRTFVIFSIVSFLSSFIWFLEFPGYRFAVAYNLNLTIILLFPLWLMIYHENRKYFDYSVKILLIIASIFFIYNNFEKAGDYINRYDYQWPKNQLLLIE